MTLENAVAELTPGKLRAWLVRLPTARHFECGNPHDCVIAEYFIFLKFEAVSITSKRIQCGFERCVTPSWVGAFLDAWDRGAARYRDIPATLRILAEFE
jgi:hypothetical protein